MPYDEMNTPIGMLSQEIDNPSLIEYWNVYSFEHIDFLGGMFDAQTALSSVENGYVLINEVASIIFQAGWEGDGRIQIFWLPPFVAVGDTWGAICFHVKQGNNGTSWIACEHELKFPGLELKYSQPRPRKTVNQLPSKPTDPPF
jgi:hypothetical protein